MDYDEILNKLKQDYPGTPEEKLQALAARSMELAKEDTPLEAPMIDPIDFIAPGAIAGKFGGIAKTLGMAGERGAARSLGLEAIEKAIPRKIPAINQITNEAVEKAGGLAEALRAKSLGQVGGTFMKDAVEQNAKIAALEKAGIGQAERISSKAMETFRGYSEPKKLAGLVGQAKDRFSPEERQRLLALLKNRSD